MSELKFKIGADPEFNLELEGKKLDAKATIVTILQKNKEFKINSKEDGFKYKNYGDIGWDGHNSTGEIRPNAENTPKELVENIKQIFTKFYEIAPSFQLSTLSRYAPIGGHVHFELNDRITSNLDTLQTKVQAIHKRMASFLLPLTLGENKVNLMVRLKGSYGKYCSEGAYRVDVQFKKPNGDNGYTYELRIPSAEWLTTPKIAQATLAYLTTVFHEITNNPKKFNEEQKDLIIRTNEIGNSLQALALTEYKILTKALYNRIKKGIKTFELYETYKEEIDYILNPAKVLADKLNADYDIRIGWGLQNKAVEASKKTILSEKKFIDISKERDLETLSKIFSIDYNNDLNVKTFIDVLQQKMAAFNWKLKKQFFFFGIRKGIDAYIVMNKDKSIIQGLEIAKTTSDKKTIEQIMLDMHNKYTQEYTQDTKTKLNFTTGKIDQITKEIFIVGIPYKDRVELNTKKFIETVYNIDKNLVKKVENKEELINDTETTEDKKGEIYKTNKKMVEEDKTKEFAIEADETDEQRTNERISDIERETSEEVEEKDLLEELETEVVTNNNPIF